MNTRREWLTGIAAGAAVLSVAGGVDAKKAHASKQGAAGKHVVEPLPFAPGKLKGLSERLLVSHHDNNYAGAVKNLNAVEAELASLPKNAPGFVVSGLKERELLFKNSKVLHELYFSNLGGDGRAGGSVEKALATAFGSFARFEEHMRETAMSLAGGSGWTMLDMSLDSGELRVHWSGNHTQAPALVAPLLVLDMYEHSYAMDFGTAAARYVDAFFQNVRWSEVDRRYQRARKALAALRA